MASDNFVTNPGAGGSTFRSLAEAGGTEHAASVAEYVSGGSSGAWTLQPVDITHGLPVQPMTGATWAATQSGAWSVSLSAALPAGGNTIGAVTQASGPWTVNITQIAGAGIAQGHGTAAAAIRVELPTDGTGTVVLAASGAVIGAVNQNGTWTVQPGNTQNTTPWLFQLSDGSNKQGTFFDLDTGAGTEWQPGFVIRMSASGGSVEAKGQKAMAASLPVAIASDQSALPASQSGTWNIATVTSLTQLNGVAITLNKGASDTGTQRVALGDGTQIIGKVGIDQTTPGTTNAVQPIVGTTGGATPGRYIAAAAANQDSTVIKNTPGQLYNCITITNVNAAVRYVKLYDKASAPTSGDTPVATYGVPGNTAGAGIVVPLPDGLLFASGIAFRMTTGIADNDANAVTANDLAMSYSYK